MGLAACLALVAAILAARSSVPADPAPGPSRIESRALIVDLSADGRLTHLGEPVSTERLLGERAGDAEVVLRVAPDCRGAAVGPVLEKLRKAGLDDLRVVEALR